MIHVFKKKILLKKTVTVKKRDRELFTVDSLSEPAAVATSRLPPAAAAAPPASWFRTTSCVSAGSDSKVRRGWMNDGVASQRSRVVGREEAANAPQPPLPPGGVGAVQHLDDVAHAEAQLVVLLRREVVERPHLQGGRPLSGRTQRRSEAAQRRSSPEEQRILISVYVGDAN